MVVPQGIDPRSSANQADAFPLDDGTMLVGEIGVEPT